jgi:3-hydroxyisobutyrate dehydrogenase
MSVEKPFRRIGAVALGKMCSTLVDALIAQGFDIGVWNRSPGKVERFAVAGIRIASTPIELARDVDVLVVNLLGPSVDGAVIPFRCHIP